MGRLRAALPAVGIVAAVLAIVIVEGIILTRWQQTAMRYQEVMRRRDQMAARLSPINPVFEKDNQVVLHVGAGDEYHRKTLTFDGTLPSFTEIWDGWQTALPIDVHVTLGALLQKSGKYVEAKNAYTDALSQAQAIASAADQEAAKCPTPEERKLFLALSDQAREKARKITAFLKDDAIRRGAEGYALFEGKWLQPAQIKEIEDRRRKEAELAFEKTQIEKGLVKADGKWVTKAEAEKIAAEKLAAEQKAKGFVLYRDKWVKREEMEAQEAALRAQKEKAAEALAAGPFSPAKREWMLEDFKSGTPWQQEPWADLVSVDVSADKGATWMSILYPGGSSSKTCLSIPLEKPLDISSRTRFLMDLKNTGNASTNISIMLTADMSYETKPYDIAPGEHKDFAIPISGKVFKCPADNWRNFAFAITRPQSVTRIGLMVNTKAQQLLVGRVRLVSD